MFVVVSFRFYLSLGRDCNLSFQSTWTCFLRPLKVRPRGVRYAVIIHLDSFFFFFCLLWKPAVLFYSICSKRMKVALSLQREDFNWSFKALLVSNRDLRSYIACCCSPRNAYSILSVICVLADVIAPVVGVSELCYWATVALTQAGRSGTFDESVPPANT